MPPVKILSGPVLHTLFWKHGGGGTQYNSAQPSEPSTGSVRSTFENGFGPYIFIFRLNYREF